MSDNSSIEWTEATWNPTTGCTKVSLGCDHCYAETMYERFNGKGTFANVKTRSDRQHLPLRWRRPRRIFVNSMSDLFHKDVPDEFIAEVFAVMALAERHTFQVLTKRHARMRSLLSDDGFRADVVTRARQREQFMRTGSGASVMAQLDPLAMWPLPNVWLGVSVEDQQWADIRIPALLATPAAVRWISAEPLLGPVDLARVLNSDGADLVCGCAGSIPGLPGWVGCNDVCMQPIPPGLDWVVVGGESGPGARPMQPEWARFLRDQCGAAGVPFLFKQWGAWAPPDQATEGAFRDWETNVGGDGTMPRRFGKKAAGRELDGHLHDGYPRGVA